MNDALNKRGAYTSDGEQKQFGLPDTLYCYLDESGDFNFGENGSKYYFQSALVTDSPYPLLKAMQEAKYSLYMNHQPFSKSHGSNDYFHATEDTRDTRKVVYDVLVSQIETYRIYPIVVHKDRTPQQYQEPKVFYQTVFQHLLGEIVSREVLSGDYRHVLVLTDRIPVQKHRQAIIGALKNL